VLTFVQKTMLFFNGVKCENSQKKDNDFNELFHFLSLTMKALITKNVGKLKTKFKGINK
jgi:hypothetical protein